MSLVEKYRPKKFSDFVGQEAAIKAVKEFIRNFPKKKALLLHGPAGSGKTSLALALANELNYELFELNSSDVRNRASLEEKLKPASQQSSLFKKGKILLMDEVDGVTGTEYGGISELARLIDSTSYPIVMTCNDVWQSKLAPIRARAKLVEVKALDIGTIVSLLSRICEAEHINKDPRFLKQIAIKSQGDLRAAINDLESYANVETGVNIDELRDREENIFNILRRLFKERDSFLDLFDKSDLSLDEIMLWIEENIPREYKGEALVRAYYALSNADVFRGRIYRNQFWRFLVYQNIFQSAGISYAKSAPNRGFTRYERPKRVLKIWLNNQKIEKKKSVSKKYAKLVHCSSKRVLKDFKTLLPILNQQGVYRALRLS
ncbi:replication factor C large subunit, partial [Candidatus Pacearchaeota archaeon]